jgi:hypothetical protein
MSHVATVLLESREGRCQLVGSRLFPVDPAYVLVLPYLLIRAHGVPDLDDTKAARDVAWRGDSGGS